MGKKIISFIICALMFASVCVYAQASEPEFKGKTQNSYNQEINIAEEKLENFEVSDEDEFKCNIDYKSEPQGEYAAQLNAASKIGTFTDSNIIKTTIELPIKNNDNKGTYTVQIKDYYGNIILNKSFDLDQVAKYIKTISFTIPSGYYTLTVLNPNNSTIISKTFAVLIDPSNREMLNDSPFAIDFAAQDIYIDDTDTAYQLASAAKLMGATYVRERSRWKYFEKEKGNYNYWSTDPLYDKIKSAGLNILTLINLQPDWVTDKNYFATEQLDAYNLLKNVSQHLNGKVQSWEIYSEQDWSANEPQAPDLYSSFLKAAALGVIDSGADATISLGALCQDPSTNIALSTYNANKIWDYTDIFNYHYHNFDYRINGSTNFLDGSVISSFTKFVKENIPDMPIWVSEAGILLNMDSQNLISKSDEKVQANYLVTSTVQSLFSGTGKHFFFVLRPIEEDGGTWSLYNYDLAPYPAVVSESIMTDVLNQGEYIGKYNADDNSDTQGYLFNNGTDDVLVLWASSSKQININTNSNVLSENIMGQKTILESTNGTVSASIGKEPTYIIFDGKAPDSIYTKSDNIKESNETVKTDPSSFGDRVILTQIWSGTSQSQARTNGYKITDSKQLTVNILNLNDTPISGNINFTSPNYTVTGDTTAQVDPYSQIQLTFTVTPNSKYDNEEFFTITGMFNNEITTPSAALVFSGNGAAPVDPTPTPVDPDPTPVDPNPTPVDPGTTPVNPDKTPVVPDSNTSNDASNNTKAPDTFDASFLSGIIVLTSAISVAFIEFKKKHSI